MSLALNVDSLKVDLVVIQNACSEKEDSNSETASSKLVKECSLNSKTKDVHAIKYKMSKAKERCMTYFRSLHSHLQVLSNTDLKGTHIEHGFRREFMSIFGQDVDTFTRTMLLNVDQLQKQLDKDEFQEDGSMAAFWVVNNQFQKFINSKFTLDYDSQMTDTYFVEYTGLEVQHFRDTLLQNLGNVKKSVAERTRHQRQYERRVNKRQMQTQESKIDTGKALDADLVDTESIRTDSTVQDDSSRSGNDTDADDADIRPIYDEEPMAEVQLTAECNIFAIGQQHTEQPEIIVEGRVDQYPETCQVKSPMLDSSPDNQTTEYSKQSLESENILLKETVAQFQKDFSRMEAHCIALELKYQNQSLKSGQHGQILNETSNKAKIEKEIDVLETMNIELEHSVATLRKENETLKQHYKDLYDSIKITRSKTTEQTTSLLANNAELKAQIQEKVFAIAALKNDLRKLKGNSVDTKFDKTSVLGKPVLPSLRNQSVVRQPNAFKSARAQMSKQRYKKGYRNSTTSVPTSDENSIHSEDRNNTLGSNNQIWSVPVSKSSRVTITAVPKADHSKSYTSFSDSNALFVLHVLSVSFIANHETFAVYEKTSPRSDLRWKPTGRIFKSVGLRWIPTGKLFDSCTSKVDSEPPHGSNVDIPHIHECKQTLDENIRYGWLKRMYLKETLSSGFHDDDTDNVSVTTVFQASIPMSIDVKSFGLLLLLAVFLVCVKPQQQILAIDWSFGCWEGIGMGRGGGWVKGVRLVSRAVEVIEKPTHGLFFMDAFGDEAFQRVSDIHKVEAETLLGYKLMASNVKTTKNKRFMVLMSRIIDEHPDKHKILNKRVKLESLGYTDI
ncbi:hypothetical protein Tco_0282784 [Tanacetum coccineum]